MGQSNILVGIVVFTSLMLMSGQFRRTLGRAGACFFGPKKVVLEAIFEIFRVDESSEALIFNLVRCDHLLPKPSK